MNSYMSYILRAILVLFYVSYIKGVELTFELPDNAKECFHEDIQKGTKATLEYQVRIFFFFIES